MRKIMETNITVERNGSGVWTYVLAGSAIGGALGYLLVSDSGRKIRRSVTHPNELADDLEGARNFIERKARVVTDQVHGVLHRAKDGIEEGQAAYREAERTYLAEAQRIESKNIEIASTVHRAVDDISRTAAGIERSVLDPVCELGALYRGLERGLRTFFGATPETLQTFGRDVTTPIYPDTKIVGG